MTGKTYSEKLFSIKTKQSVSAGDIVFAEPDLILSHDNSASIYKTFQKMGGTKIKYPNRLVIVLDHDSPPTSVTIANDHKTIRELVKNQNITNYYDEGVGICHQLMSNHALPNMLIVGSDSHTCTSGAFTAFSAGIDRTETAGLWLTGKTWFRVPETIKIELEGELPPGVYAKDIALYIMNAIGAAGALYKSIEFHGEGVKNLSISERMTLANLASEMGAKTAIFPPDVMLVDWLKKKHSDKDIIAEDDLFWSDDNAIFSQNFTVTLGKLEPLIAIPHQVDNAQFISDVGDIFIHQAFLGTCTNARLDDLTIAASVLKGKRVKEGVVFLVAPASQEIYLKAMENDIIQTLVKAGATILSCSCGPCLGKGQGIPADGWNIISTANRNFLGRMGNKNSSIYLASPATVAASAIAGKIVDPREYLSIKIIDTEKQIELQPRALEAKILVITSEDDRNNQNIWNYSDINDFNTDQMFAGGLTYDIKSSDGEKIVPHLFKGLDETFAMRVKKGDIVIGGENFGCGSSREHPAVGLATAGVKAVIVKSVSRIFYRSAINQGLPIIVHPELVDNFDENESISIDLENGRITNGERVFLFPKLPEELLDIFNAGGLIKHYQKQHSE
ncbi:MAG: 3-isopropylmalate dehydratase large subunit [Candidatus Heimdallarchaeota archaeon]|nr:3-isopropylmalate dehydratase large subunit [Candidatus Heimdallarchaeota archaeon]MCK4878919.1 3-isopropylmalate dehydratase large subunit [Candidatus Heimdallarchaeota archaeon]